MPITIERLRARRKAAQSERDQFQPLLDEAYEYAIPYRRSTALSGKGEKRVDRIFDQTAVSAAFRFAGKLQQDLWPTGQENFKIEPGPVISASSAPETEELRQFRAVLENITGIVGSFFLGGEWDQAFHEMAIDLSAGTGAMLMLEGDAQRPMRFVTVPLDEVLFGAGSYGDITGIFWSRKWALDGIKEDWPECDLGVDLELKLKEKPETEVKLNQDTTFDKARKRWTLTVWIDKGDGVSREILVSRSESRTCPWLTPRYFRVAGETMGRGPTMLAMPTIKVLNKAQQLTLQAAAIALLGIYTVVDDGVFNPDHASITPASFWKVARNGGTLGPSVQRFQDPRLDLTQIVLNELRMAVQATMMDQSLPPDGAAVRSATEILERVKRLASDHLGAFGRLVQEVVVPAVTRAIEIAHNKLLIPNAPPIDQLLVKVRVTSPIALAREAERIEKIVQWLQMVLALLPAAADEVAHVAEALTEVGQAMTVPLKLIVTPDERRAIRKRKQEEALALAAASAAGGGQLPMAA